jgi:serine/threonine protein kinase
MVQDFISGKTIHQLPAHHFTPRAVKIILHHVLMIADHLLSQKVCHSDLSDSNIMIDRTGKLIVIDFGLSKRIAARGMPRDAPHRYKYTEECKDPRYIYEFAEDLVCKP